MTKPERGVKRVCASCGARFFDLSHQPIVCPKCQAVFVIPEPPEPRRSGFATAPKPVARAPAEAPEDLLEPDEEETSPVPEEDEEADKAVDEDDDALRALDEVEESDLGQEGLSEEE